MSSRQHHSTPSDTGSDRLYSPRIGKGLMLFTGPDGICNHKVSVLEPRFIGIGTMSPEGTSDLSYLWRPAKTTQHASPKHFKVGEIGWGIGKFQDRKLSQSGNRILRGEFRQSCEDRHTHLYQNPWYPPPQSKSGKPKDIKQGALFFNEEDDVLSSRGSSRASYTSFTSSGGVSPSPPESVIMSP